MLRYRLYKFPILVSIAIAQIVGNSIAPVRAASVNLDTPKAQSDCPKNRSNSSAEGAKLLPEKDSEVASLTNKLSKEDSSNLIAQIPENNSNRPLDSGCEVSGEGACEIAGDDGCQVGGPPPAEGGGLLAPLAAAGFNPLLLAPLALIPLIPGGGGDDPNPPTEPIPEPSTVFGSTLALGAVAAIASRHKSRKPRNGKKDK